MTRYVFDEPDAMLRWIEETAFKLLSIPREEFGKIEVNISKTDCGATWSWLVEPRAKEMWQKRKENEKK